MVMNFWMVMDRKSLIMSSHWVGLRKLRLAARDIGCMFMYTTDIGCMFRYTADYLFVDVFIVQVSMMIS